MSNDKNIVRYCLGFIFTDYPVKSVLMVKKNKPDWMKGKWNGIGGKVEDGESFSEAMKREAIEEIGYPYTKNWVRFGTLSTIDVSMALYKTFDHSLNVNVPTQNDVGEEVRLIPIDTLNNLRADCMYNIPMLINASMLDNVEITVFEY